MSDAAADTRQLISPSQDEKVDEKVPCSEWNRAIMQARTNKKLTQADLAMLIREKPSTIRKYESGEVIPDQQIITKLERALGVKLPVDWESVVIHMKAPTAEIETVRKGKMSDVAADTRQLINPSQEEEKRFDPDLLKVKFAELKKLPRQQQRDWLIAHLILLKHAVLFGVDDEEGARFGFGPSTDDDFKVEYYEEEEEEEDDDDDEESKVEYYEEEEEEDDDDDEESKNDDRGCLLDQPGV